MSNKLLPELYNKKGEFLDMSIDFNIQILMAALQTRGWYYNIREGVVVEDGKQVPKWFVKLGKHPELNRGFTLEVYRDDLPSAWSVAVREFAERVS